MAAVNITPASAGEDFSPVTAEEFSAALAACAAIAPSGIFEKPLRMTVAVSGGGDSMALCLLMQEWQRAHGGDLLALTVDHGLRQGSADEAALVATRLQAFGIPHRTLVWHGEKPATHVQARAREARYALLLDACSAEGFPLLALAHNQEDQLETFWMRLAHGSGLDGLAGMAPLRRWGDVTLLRPLLNFPRARLRDTCRRFGVEWVEDPSNQDARYLRVRLRAFEELLAAEGMSPDRLTRTLQKLAEARDALQQSADNLFLAAVSLHAEGYMTIRRDLYVAAPADLRRRVLARALRGLSPQPYPPGAAMVEKADADICAGLFTGCTLAGCLLQPVPSGDALLVCREADALAAPMVATSGAVWDRRFTLSLPHNGAGCESLTIAALGEVGIATLRKKKPRDDALETRLRHLPQAVRVTLPALWQDENLVSVPHLSWHDAAFPQARPALFVFQSAGVGADADL